MSKSRPFRLLRLSHRLDYRYIYVLGNSRYLCRYKIGIAKSVENRTKNIEGSLKGNTYEIFAARFFFAQKIEQSFHKVYSPLSAKMQGSGKTEWFWMLLPVTPVVFLSLLWILQWIFIPTAVATAFYLWNNRAAFIGNLF
jgi:hypothetical protein